MPAIIHLVRHAQGLHNVGPDLTIPDPELTELGREQCAAVASRFPFHEQVTHVVASPMRRTLYTALLSFDLVLQRTSSKVTALPLIQEISTFPCDVGSPVARLRDEFGDRVDLSETPEDWYRKGPSSPYAPDILRLEARARAARVWLRDLARRDGGDGHIVVVSHGGFLHFLTGDWEGIQPGRATGWENTEFRSYEFTDPLGHDEKANLRETQESRRRRRGSAASLTEAEMRELRAVEQAHVQKEFDLVEKDGLGVKFE